MAKKYIVSAFGKDRPGIVADVSQVLYENGCNLEDTRMTNLSGEFSLMILFSSQKEDDMGPALSPVFAKLEKEKGIAAYLRPVSAQVARPTASAATQTLRVEGLDHTGIVYKISRFLADRHINIANLESAITYAPESGAPVYTMEIEIETDQGEGMETFGTDLGRLADELHVEIAID